MNRSYQEYISGVIESSIMVELENATVEKIHKFAKQLAEKKKNEQHHVVDGRKEEKRFTTGLMGEAALEKILGIDIVDWTIGNSNAYFHPDIPNYKVGIKTVEYGKFPIIFKNSHEPEIICIIDPEKTGVVYVCGLATKEVLNQFQDDDLIIDSNLRARGTKTGFYGFSSLKKITGINDLAPYKMAGVCEKKVIPDNVKLCPLCNAPMKKRSGRFGEFWGCSRFPLCRHSESI